jgi:SAM-dependent MidA family methyltransferase
MNEGDFEPVTENAALIELLRRRIEAEGPITFHDYMEAVLYDPQHGYYATRLPVGREGDYLTSPEVNSVFGALVAKQLLQCWRLMGEPNRFDVIEPGAGTGRLARDILRWAARREPAFARAIRYRIVEVSPALRAQQRETLSGCDEVEWLEELPGEIEGCVVSNELLDSFPVHRVVRVLPASPLPRNLPPSPLPKGRGNLRELYVGWSAGRFAEERGELSTERIARYFADLGIEPSEGCVAEVNLHAIDWMRDVAQRMRRGFVLTFDYGYEASELYAPWRRDGTLMCFYRHNPSSDPYTRAGKQDMTSHVDFTSLMRAGREGGLEVAGFTTQARFLANMGIGEGMAAAKESPEALEEYYARRRAVQELIDPAGLGRIRVLAQRKGVEAAVLQGFADG